ncbi:MAG: DUF1559 domain-containing protein [Capsulimonadaceae bacterium]|nr:DUF1559 domain-containing protein [Capsulimonadaceae bacterium]
MTKAFTLIELLVVIAIIAILAAILFPVFATAREKARQTQCASNMKEISLAILQYVQDNDEMFPAQAAYSLSGGQWLADGAHPSWLDLQAPYLKSAAISNCPSDPYPPTTSSNTAYPVAGASGPNASYAINEYLVSRYFPGNPGNGGTFVGLPTFTGTSFSYSGVNGLAMSRIARPGNVVLLSETTLDQAITPNMGTDICWETINWLSTVKAGGSQPPALRHSAGANYSYTDGHVHWNAMLFIPGGSNGTGCGGQVYFNNTLPVPSGATTWYPPSG